MQPVLSKLTPAGTSSYYSDRWITILESHINYLKTARSTDINAVEKDVQSRYMGNPYGLFVHLKIEPMLHHITMRCNGWQKPEDFNEFFDFLLIPSAEELASIHRVSRMDT